MARSSASTTAPSEQGDREEYLRHLVTKATKSFKAQVGCGSVGMPQLLNLRTLLDDLMCKSTAEKEESTPTKSLTSATKSKPKIVESVEKKKPMPVSEEVSSQGCLVCVDLDGNLLEGILASLTREPCGLLGSEEPQEAGLHAGGSGYPQQPVASQNVS